MKGLWTNTLICFFFSASSHHLLQLDWIFLDHHLLLKTRQNSNAISCRKDASQPNVSSIIFPFLPSRLYSIAIKYENDFFPEQKVTILIYDQPYICKFHLYLYNVIPLSSFKSSSGNIRQLEKASCSSAIYPRYKLIKTYSEK